jgi:excisionase family DNA binding protein
MNRLLSQLLTAKEAGHILRLNVFSVYEMARDGRLPTVHIGRGIRFRPEDLEAWLAAGGSDFSSKHARVEPPAHSSARQGKRTTRSR